MMNLKVNFIVISAHKTQKQLSFQTSCPSQPLAPVKSAEVLSQPKSSEMKIDDSDDDTLDYFSKLLEEE